VTVGNVLEAADMRRVCSRRRMTGSLGLLVLLAGPVAAHAQPAISATAGAWSHKSTVTITGSGFGAKSVAAPTVWDDASGANILDKWDGAWPNGTAAYTLAYRAPQRGISLPHGNITRYIAGAHGSLGGPQDGYNVIMFKTRTIANPSYTYASWYQRVDDGWVFGDDDNFKTFAFSTGTTPYELPNNWYAEYNPRPTSRTSGASYHLNDDATGSANQSLQTPDQNGHSWWWDGAVNPMGGSWTKVEMEMKYTSQADGYVRLWENGVLKINYAGSTDKYAGGTRTEGIGGYARNYNQPNNWRYFADVYLDYSRARIILGNAATFAASTVREVQIPASWSSTSITVAVNLGRFAAGQTAYLYVVDANGQVNANGRAVTIGSSTAPPPPDTTAPSVTTTAPANGSTVSATVAVSATAADNAGVAGVQFRLDGVNLGAEDTTAPYSISWNTTTAPNGAHVLTAVARDASGNQATSPAVNVTVSNSAAPPPPPNQTAGLVAAYGFNAGAGTTAADASGQQNTGAISGAQWVAQGRYGAALRFDGVDDMVRVADAASLDLTSGMTLEAWVQPTTLSGWRSVIMKEVSGGLAYTLYAHDNAPKPAAYVRIAGKTASDATSGTAALPLNTWSHLAATYDGATLRLYVNAVQVASRAVSGSIVTSANPLNVGGNSVWGEYFSGLIDEVRVYSRALTAAEVQTDMSSPIGGTTTSAPKAPTNVRIVQ
jgi:hypothetical protein